MEGWKRTGKGWNGIQARGQVKTRGMECPLGSVAGRGPGSSAAECSSRATFSCLRADSDSVASQVHPGL